MTRTELADIVMELEGQRRALQEKGYTHSADHLSNTIGKLCCEHVIEIVTSLKFWDAPLSLTKELTEEQITKRKPLTPTQEEAKKLQ